MSRINRFALSEFLKQCNALSNWIDRQAKPNLLINVPESPRYNVSSPCRVYLTPATIPFLAKTALLRTSDMRQHAPTIADFRGLAFMYANLQDASVNPGGPKPDPYSTLVRVAWEQFVHQEHLQPIIPRARLLLIDGNRDLSADRPFDLEEQWIKTTGIELEKFMVVGFGYFAGALHHTSLARHFSASGALAGTITPDDCEGFLARAGAMYKEFQKTEFNVLNKRPLLVVRGELIAPVPRLLAYRISEGLFFDIADMPWGRQFRDYFGRLFEHYVGRLLKWTFGEANVHPEPMYGKSSKRGPDWVVLDGDTALLFECRSSRLRLDSKVYADRDGLIRDTSRIFLDTLTKFQGKMEVLKSGKAGIDCSKIADYKFIIITYDPTHFESYFRDIARQEFASRGLAPFEDYHLIGISDLETLSAWHRTKSMKSVLLDRSEQMASGPSISDFNAFVREYSRRNGLSIAHPLLTQVQEEFFEKYFHVQEMDNEVALDRDPNGLV